MSNHDIENLSRELDRIAAGRDPTTGRFVKGNAGGAGGNAYAAAMSRLRAKIYSIVDSFEMECVVHALLRKAP
jgi:hypothetical protein